MSMLTTKSSRISALLRDVVLPMGLFYVLRAFDVDVLWALLISGLTPVLRFGYVLVRHRRVEPLSAFTLAVLAINVALSLISGDPRLLLVRSAWISLLFGCWLIGSLFFAKRPLVFTAVRAMLPDRAAELDRRWASDSRPWTVATAFWGVGNLLLAGVIVAMAYTLPVDVVPVLDTLLTAGSVVLGVKLTIRSLSARAARTVDA